MTNEELHERAAALHAELLSHRDEWTRNQHGANPTFQELLGADMSTLYSLCAELTTLVRDLRLRLEVLEKTGQALP